MEKYVANISSFRKTERLELIRKLSGSPKISDKDALFLNDLVIYESQLILDCKGQYFDVSLGERDKRKYDSGMCYANAFDKMGKVYSYVEGYILSLNGKKVAHAWNMDKNGNHVYFSVDKNEGYIYRGIIVPENIVWDVGFNNGGVTYAVLPFVDDIS